MYAILHKDKLCIDCWFVFAFNKFLGLIYCLVLFWLEMLNILCLFEPLIIVLLFSEQLYSEENANGFRFYREET